jgi:hypothetical protein
MKFFTDVFYFREEKALLFVLEDMLFGGLALFKSLGDGLEHACE